MSGDAAGAEIRAVTDELERLMGQLRLNVAALEEILTTEPEVPSGEPATT